MVKVAGGTAKNAKAAKRIVWPEASAPFAEDFAFLFAVTSSLRFMERIPQERWGDLTVRSLPQLRDLS
jgi:hypothetical protein